MKTSSRFIARPGLRAGLTAVAWLLAATFGAATAAATVIPSAVSNASAVSTTSTAAARPATAVATTTAAAPVQAPLPHTQKDPQVHRGAYLARAGDCIACHTAAGGRPFAGGLPIDTPFGTIYSSNITPDKTTGIGDYTFEDFDRAVRDGVSKHSGNLYPAMPYPSYRILSHDDMQALYAYFTRGVSAVQQANQPNGLKFPFNIRPLMIGWNLLFLKGKGSYRYNPSKSAEWNRGAYLIEGLGHCGACHTPHGVTGQEKAFSERGGGPYLGGATLGGWNAPTLAGDIRSGLAGWSKADIAAFLKTGRTAHSAAFGAMTEVVGDSTQYLSDADLEAMAEYLKSLPGAVRAAPAAAQPPSPPAAPDAATYALRQGDLSARGARVYLDNCNACHRSDGTGAPRTFPALTGNPVISSSDPTSLIHLVLTGSRMPSAALAPAPLAMPDFAWRLTDQQVADVLSFIRSNWGNHAAPVDAATVAKVRRQTGAAAVLDVSKPPAPQPARE
ncbi:c-type cytochrome [Paraburkholderia bonniea]|uniref:c-type cytochrome n=1 Tax=Paraburkholderia bonniea TaxID=2152891 RepID=UPI00129126D6|nr:cytochrome c [Paraburkholderia bonniea]